MKNPLNESAGGVCKLTESQRNTSTSSGGMNLARREATRSAVDSPMPVHDLDLANTPTCRALEVECWKERSTGSELIRPPGRKRRLSVLRAREGLSSTGRLLVERRPTNNPANPS